MSGRTKRTRMFVTTAVCALAMALAHRPKRRALHECHQLGCRLAVWVANQYAALVLKRNGVFVAGVGLTKNLAFAKARERAHEPTAKKYAWVYGG
ncbi:MAG: hypothetical protein JSS68_00925 [Actinobacteria bacterium]|nr:hypothetical protein [Actinomycetota bacterium]